MANAPVPTAKPGTQGSQTNPVAETPLPQAASTDFVHMGTAQATLDTFVMRSNLNPRGADTQRLVDTFQSDETKQMMSELAQGGYDGLNIRNFENMPADKQVQAIFEAAQDLAAQEELTVAPDIPTAMDQVPMPSEKSGPEHFAPDTSPMPLERTEARLDQEPPTMVPKSVFEVKQMFIKGYQDVESQGYDINDVFMNEFRGLRYAETMTMFNELSEIGGPLEDGKINVPISSGMTAEQYARAAYTGVRNAAIEQGISTPSELKLQPGRGSAEEVLQDQGVIGFSTDPDLEKMVFYSEQYDALVVQEKGEDPVRYDAEDYEHGNVFKEFYDEAFDAVDKHPEFHTGGMPDLHRWGVRGVTSGTENILDGSAEFWQIAGKTVGLVANRYPVASGLLKARELWQKSELADNLERAEQITPEANADYQEFLLAEATYGVLSTAKGIGDSVKNKAEIANPMDVSSTSVSGDVRDKMGGISTEKMFLNEFEKLALEHKFDSKIQKVLKPGSNSGDIAEVAQYGGNIVHNYLKTDVMPLDPSLCDGSIDVSDAREILNNAHSFLDRKDYSVLQEGETRDDAEHTQNAMEHPDALAVLNLISSNEDTSIKVDLEPDYSIIDRSAAILRAARERADQLGFEPSQTHTEATIETERGYVRDDDSHDMSL